MKKILSLILAAMLCTNVALAESKSATTFVSNLVDDIVKNVLSSKDTKEKKAELFEQYILQTVDTEAIARTVLAQYWRTATPKERDDFIDAFKNMAVKMSAERFNVYTGQEVKFFSERPAQGKNQVFVDSTVSSDQKPIQVVWRVREKNGEYRVLDIIIEGVSMTLSYRNEYTSYLQNHTMQELINELKYQAEHAAETAEKQKQEAKKTAASK